MTRDVITTLGLLLGAALAARFVAGLLKVPEMLVLVAVGVLVSGVVDVPLDSTGAQLLFTLGVSMILFYGGLNLSLAVLRRVWVSLSLLVVPGVVLTAVVTGVAAYAVFDLSWTAGIAGGLLLAVTISSRRIGIWDESAGLAVLAVVAIGYVSLDSAGGSGYLGAFLAGLIVGNMEHLRLGMHSEHEEDMRRFASNLSDLATLLVFVVLGANIPLDDLADNLLPALAVLAMLLLVARPLTVLACVLPDRGGGWTWREIAFLCWTRETGVVPAALVGVIVGLGVPNGDIYASVVALAIVVTLVLQALPAPWLARRLGLLDEVSTAAGSDPLPTE